MAPRKPGRGVLFPDGYEPAFSHTAATCKSLRRFRNPHCAGIIPDPGSAAFAILN